MFITNNKLIENISNEFGIEKEEANNIINNLFGNITLSILNGKKFYMDKIGVISINDDCNIELSNYDENFDDSLESIDTKNNYIKNIFLEKSIYKSIFKNILNISKEEEVYIENFGYFKNSDTIFKVDPILQNIISIKFNKENTNNSNINNDDIIKKLDNTLESIYSKEKNKEIIEDIPEQSYYESNEENHNNDDNDITEIVDNDNSIDNDIVKNIFTNKSYNSNINNEYTIEDIINNKNITNDDINENNEDYPEMIEYTEEELLDINNFDSSDLDKEELSEINEEVLENDKKEHLKVLNEYENEIENVQKLETEPKKNIQKNTSSLFGGIVKVIFIIAFILVIGIFVSKYYNNNIISNDIENQQLYYIINTYFDNDSSSVSLSYITSKDMYYWDIAKALYGDATYWPLIYSYNSDKYRISNIIKKGSSISYRSIPSNNSSKDIKLLNNTLSKSYILIYPILTNDKKYNHALWALKLSAYYDLDVFKNNASIMPKETYDDILKENNGIKNIYSNVVNNKNMFMSFVEKIKQKLGITK